MINRGDLPIKLDLPDGFLDEEVRSGYLISNEMKQIWAVELDMLVEFDRICKKLEIQYFLDSGTLLGAVRHKGFIPWDDDIDVIMLRKDYDILINNGTSLFRYPYFLQCAYTDAGYYRGHAQIRNSETAGILPQEKKARFNQGIFIDVFVLDGLTPNREHLKKQFDVKNKIQKIFKKKYPFYSDNQVKMFLNWCRSIVYHIRYRDDVKLYQTFERILKRYSKSLYVDKIGFYTDCNKVHYLKKNWYLNSIDCSFEGFSFPIPQEYDVILKMDYGEDYMIPQNNPTLHGEIMFDTQRSYKEVLNIRG